MAGVTETAHNKLKERVQALEIAAAPPNSWVQRHQVLTWLISLTSVILSIVIAIFSGVIPHIEKDDGQQIKSQVNEGLKQPLQKIGQMSDEIAEINGTLKAWAPFMTPQFFKKTVSLPDKQFLASLPQLKAAVQIASQSKAEALPKDIADIGKRTITLASENSNSSPLAWDTTMTLLQYRSVLNSLSPPTDLDATMAVTAYSTHYAASAEPGQALPTVSSTRLDVPEVQAAAMDFIGVDRNKNSPRGPAMLIAAGGSMILDNMHLKNVVLLNVHVTYKRGSTTDGKRLLSELYLSDNPELSWNTVGRPDFR